MRQALRSGDRRNFIPAPKTGQNALPSHRPKELRPTEIPEVTLNPVAFGIHPFPDGNGRIGRLLIPLFLISSGILKAPVLCLSDYLKRHRAEYYERLTLVREKNDIAGWLHFFLDGVAETAAQGVTTFDQILKFRQHWETEIARWPRHSKAGAVLLPHLFTRLWVNAAGVAEVTRVSTPTAYKILETFTRSGLLRETTGAHAADSTSSNPTSSSSSDPEHRISRTDPFETTPLKRGPTPLKNGS